MAQKIKRVQSSSELSPFRRELYGIFFLAIGVFFGLCLLSYYPLDPSFFTLSSGGAVHNWGGIAGSYLSDLLFFLFGAGAYFIGLFFFFISLLLFSGNRSQVHVHDILIYMAFVVLVSVLFQLTKTNLHFGAIPGVAPEAAGGVVGNLLASVGVSFLGQPGAYLLVICGAVFTFVWATRLTLKEVGLALAKFFIPIGKFLVQQFVLHSARTQKMISKWWEGIKMRRRQEKQKEAAALDQVKINKPTPVPLSTKPLASTTSATPLSKIPVPEAVSLHKEGGEQLLDGEPRILDRIDKKRKAISSQLELANMSAGYQLPPISLLDSDSQQEEVVVDEESLKMQSRMLEKKLLDFNVEGRVTEIHPGPVITMYEFEPAPGVKLSRIANLVDDLSLAMGGRPVRIVAPLPNKPAVGIEIPNHVRETVWLKDIIVDEKFQKNESRLVFALGKDIEGIPYVTDLAKMPHLLVAGATGAGKSVSINSMIISILYKAKPEEVRLIMVDPKMLELSLYEGIPHLLLPVVTEPKKAALALRWAVREMERRYKLLSDINARNIINYNKKVEKKDFVSKQAEEKKLGISISDEDEITHEAKIPYIVILIDELADLMMVSSREVEEAITRLAQMARAAGIHLILATQRPSVDVLTGVIKANFPARISFKVSSKHDARTILDTVGSEHLLGSGDMLMIPPGASRMIRVHGAYVTETEIGRIVDFLKKQAKPIYDETILKPIVTESGEGGVEGEEENDELYDQAVAIVSETRQASISMIQRKLRIGYNRAARMIEKMETEGIVSSPSGAGHRQVLVSSLEAS